MHLFDWLLLIALCACPLPLISLLIREVLRTGVSRPGMRQSAAGSHGSSRQLESGGDHDTHEHDSAFVSTLIAECA